METGGIPCFLIVIAERTVPERGKELLVFGALFYLVRIFSLLERRLHFSEAFLSAHLSNQMQG